VQILEWYDELVRLTDSPVARLNRAVAVGEADGPRAGLAALEELDLALPAIPPPPRTCTSVIVTQ
jgi:predicted RNA polymerase sigma factor